MTSDPGLGRIDEAVHVANAYIDARNYERAREVVSRALAHNPSDSSLLKAYARAEYGLGNYESAARSAHAALSGAAEDELAMRVYASSLFGLGRRRDGLWMAWRTVKAHPNMPEPLRLYGWLLYKTSQLRSALVVVDEALRLSPHSVDAYILRGSILHAMGMRAEADACYQAALQLDPANPEALNDLAVHRLERNKWGRALRGFLGAAGSDPEYGKLARRNIAVVLRKVLILVTVVAGLLGVFVGFAAVAYVEGHSTAVLRVLAALLTGALIAVLRWLIRAIPRPVLVAVLREQHFAALRLGHALAAIVAGVWIAIIPRPEAMAAVGGLVAVSALIIIRIGLSIGK